MRRLNHSLHLRDWTRANAIIRDWEIAGSIKEETNAETTVRATCAAFIADAVAQRLDEETLRKYKSLLVNTRKPQNRDKHSPSLRAG